MAQLQRINLRYGLRPVLAELGINIVILSDRLGMSAKNFHTMLTRNNMQLSTLERIADALCMSTGGLLVEIERHQHPSYQKQVAKRQVAMHTIPKPTNQE